MRFFSQLFSTFWEGEMLHMYHALEILSDESRAVAW
jgi:hypothetical protein